MNLGFMQQLQEQRNQGNSPAGADALLQDSPGMRLGQGLNIDPAHDGSALAVEAQVKSFGPQDSPEKVHKSPEGPPQGLGATFANEVIRRMGEVEGEDGQPKDSTDLRHSLGQSMDWLRERFGDETAAAAAGMVIQSTSSGVNEESLGNGLLNVVKFIDRNFGITAGDAVMDKFNSGVNVELNEFFDNGQNEIFFAKTTPLDGSGLSATQDLNARFFMRAVQADQGEETDGKNLTEKLLEDLKAELDKVAELQDLTSKLEAELNPAKATPQAAVAAYEATPGVIEPQLANLTV